MRAYPLSLDASSYLLFFQTSSATPQHYSTCRFPFTSTSSNKNTPLSSLFTLSQTHSTPTPANCSNSDFTNLDANDDDDFDFDDLLELKSESLTGDGVYIEIEKFGRNSRRIQSKIEIEANLDTVWNILTDYERLVDFIPGLAVSELVEKKDNFARLYQADRVLVYSCVIKSPMFVACRKVAPDFTEKVDGQVTSRGGRVQKQGLWPPAMFKK